VTGGRGPGEEIHRSFQRQHQESLVEEHLTDIQMYKLSKRFLSLGLVQKEMAPFLPLASLIIQLLTFFSQADSAHAAGQISGVCTTDIVRSAKRCDRCILGVMLSASSRLEPDCMMQYIYTSTAAPDFYGGCVYHL
jgi:hypothetical protein